MSIISLKEFRSITKISESALVWLLENKALPIQMAPDYHITIDMSRVDIQRLVTLLNKELTQTNTEEYNLMVEEAGKVIRNEMESLIDAALSRTK